MAIEEVPNIPMFRQNTAGFVHDLPRGDLSNVDGESNYVRVQVLTNADALDRDKQIKVVSQFTALVGEAAGDPTLTDRTVTQAVPGGWRLGGHAQYQRRTDAGRSRPDRRTPGWSGEGVGLRPHPARNPHAGDRTQPKNPLFLMSSATPVGTIGSQASSPSAIRLRTSRLKIER